MAVGKLKQVTVLFPPDESCCALYVPKYPFALVPRHTKLSSAELDKILDRHFIDAELCRADKFDAFVVDRAKKILEAVEECTGRKVSGRDSPEIKKVFGASLQ